MSTDHSRLVRGLLISNAADFVSEILGRFERTMVLFAISWNAEAIMEACKDWHPEIVVMDNSAISGPVASLLIRGLCTYDPTLIGVDNPEIAYVYRLGQGMRLALPATFDTLTERLEASGADELPI